MPPLGTGGLNKVLQMLTIVITVFVDRYANFSLT
jgi:hypothetical protein